MTSHEVKQAVLTLSHDVGREDRGFAILGEGNTSGRVDDTTFWIKASGGNLATLADSGVVECTFAGINHLIEKEALTDHEIEDGLFASRVDPSSKKPSVEAVFHAVLLQLPGIRFVAHAHPIVTNQILCSPLAEKFATQRIFPDEVVVCGAESVLVPYCDPGLTLARVIQKKTELFIEDYGILPRVILLRNHGAITLGPTPQSAEAAMLMLEKAAKIFVGAASLGGPVFMTPEDVRRIASRIDEHYRQKELNL
ncbi:MAG TPA: class II aldolase/adducin family protein [Chthoniobacterales bacterium]